MINFRELVPVALKSTFAILILPHRPPQTTLAKGRSCPQSSNIMIYNNLTRIAHKLTDFPEAGPAERSLFGQIIIFYNIARLRAIGAFHYNL